MNNWIIRQRIDLAQGAVEPRILPSALMMQGDKLAHEWRITVLQDGQPATLAGTVRGFFQRADGNYVPIAGTIDGHTAVVKLESTCYTIPGSLQCVMRLTDTSGNNTVTLGVLITTVGREPSGGIVDVEHIIPDISQLLAQVAVMEAGITAANGAAATATAAAGQATAATSAAETATNAATDAAASATAASGAATTAAAAANSAATAANEAKQEASDAASDAVLAAGDADDAADAANAAAGAANTAASGANTAATAANTAAAAATAAVGQATSAAGSAGTAAQAADAAATMIDGMTIATSSVPNGTAPTATITDVNGHKHITIQTEQGPQGADYIIKGNAYATLAELQAGIPNPTIGDRYNVGSAAPYNVHRWTGTQWEDEGQTTGYSPVAYVSKVGNTATITITDKTGTTEVDVLDGTDGLPGAPGASGATFTPAVSETGVVSFENDKALPNPSPVDIVAAVKAILFATTLTIASDDTTTIKAAIDACLKSANVYNSLDKAVEGFVLDARQGKALKALIDGLYPVKYTAQTLTDAEKVQALSNISAASVTQVSNPNMLRNWDFRTPINQRNRVSGTAFSTAGSYYLDGWVLGGSSVTWVAGTGLSMAAGGIVYQFMEYLYTALLGRVVTFSALMSDGTIYTATGAFPASVSGVAVSTVVPVTGFGNVTFGLSYVSGGIVINETTQYYAPYLTVFASSACIVRTVKLEIGTVSTIAMDAPMSSALALAVCQRHLVRTSLGASSGYHDTAGYFAINLPLPCAMRITPSIAEAGANAAFVCSNGSVYQSVAVTSVISLIGNLCRLRFTAALPSGYSVVSTAEPHTSVLLSSEL